MCARVGWRNLLRPKSGSTTPLIRIRSCFTALVLLTLTGCGYHVVGSSTRLPISLRTLAIPAFSNKTQTYHVEQTLTAAVVREFQSRTHYRVVNKKDDGDAVLNGTILTLQASPLTYDSKTLHASSYLVTVTARVTLVDHQGKVLFENPSYTFRQEYEVAREFSSFFEEESPALERMSNDFARTLVSDVMEAY